MSAELTHPSIKDGWFREISDTMWPGQAMTLRVKKVLHSARSQYQDVCYFSMHSSQLFLTCSGVSYIQDYDEPIEI